MTKFHTPNINKIDRTKRQKNKTPDKGARHTIQNHKSVNKVGYTLNQFSFYLFRYLFRLPKNALIRNQIIMNIPMLINIKTFVHQYIVRTARTRYELLASSWSIDTP